jgi:hypothetical protein
LGRLFIGKELVEVLIGVIVDDLAHVHYLVEGVRFLRLLIFQVRICVSVVVTCSTLPSVYDLGFIILLLVMNLSPSHLLLQFSDLFRRYPVPLQHLLVPPLHVPQPFLEFVVLQNNAM